MSNSNNSRGTLPQRFWRHIRNLYRQLRPCRFSFIVALLACPIFLSVAQGTEILRTVGEGMAGGQSYGLRVFGFFLALVLWSLSSWYAARVLLYLTLQDGACPTDSKLAERIAPRLLGIAPFLIVGAGFLTAAAPYDSASPAKLWLNCFAGLCLVLAIVFY